MEHDYLDIIFVYPQTSETSLPICIRYYIINRQINSRGNAISMTCWESGWCTFSAVKAGEAGGEISSDDRMLFSRFFSFFVRVTCTPTRRFQPRKYSFSVLVKVCLEERISTGTIQYIFWHFVVSAIQYIVLWLYYFQSLKYILRYFFEHHILCSC